MYLLGEIWLKDCHFNLLKDCHLNSFENVSGLAAPVRSRRRSASLHSSDSEAERARGSHQNQTQLSRSGKTIRVV